MSSAYATEPVTTGLVILRTSSGDIHIELWAREAPQTCRYFLQRCLEGRYDQKPFHRVVHDFLVQAGEPHGTALGDENKQDEDEQPLPIERHSRLRFRYRGMVAMAAEADNEDKEMETACRDSSQFFITLTPAEHLNGKHTIFGKVSGDSIYTVTKIGEVEVDDTDRPVYPPVIRTISVVTNPFANIVVQHRCEITRSQPIERDIKGGSNNKAVKNRKLLSFDDRGDLSDEELEPQDILRPSESSGRSVSLLPTSSPSKKEELVKQSKLVAGETDRGGHTKATGHKIRNTVFLVDDVDNEGKVGDSSSTADARRSAWPQNRHQKNRALEDEDTQTNRFSDDANAWAIGDDVEPRREGLDTQRVEKANKSSQTNPNEEFRKLREELVRKQRELEKLSSGKIEGKNKRVSPDKNEESPDLASTTKSRIEKYRSAKTAKGSTREEYTLKRLSQFSSKLRGGSETESRSKLEGALEELRTELHFPRDPYDVQGLDDLAVIDPLRAKRGESRDWGKSGRSSHRLERHHIRGNYPANSHGRDSPTSDRQNSGGEGRERIHDSSSFDIDRSDSRKRRHRGNWTDPDHERDQHSYRKHHSKAHRTSFQGDPDRLLSLNRRGPDRDSYRNR